MLSPSQIVCEIDPDPDWSEISWSGETVIVPSSVGVGVPETHPKILPIKAYW